MINLTEMPFRAIRGTRNDSKNSVTREFTVQSSEYPLGEPIQSQERLRLNKSTAYIEQHGTLRGLVRPWEYTQGKRFQKRVSMGQRAPERLSFVF